MLALVPLFPLIGFLVNGFLYLFGTLVPEGKGRQGHGHGHAHGNGHGHDHAPSAHADPAHGSFPSASLSGMIASGAIFLSFLVSLLLFLQLHGAEAEHRVIEETLLSWISVGTLKLDLGLRVDSLSTLFTLVITGVGTLIHIYSIGYMSHDATPAKFFAYLNLFCFSMLMLVLGSSLPVLFLGWEGVGLCSYLLIGYWYTDIEKAKAGKKAFVVNRIGDLGFLLGIFLIFYAYGSLDFVALKSAVASGTASVELITAICLLLFVGCMGKSAQFPLYVWLPDAMAGPTPVSALIHAATMVTSGVYMISRLNFLYSLAPAAQNIIACVGAFTAFFAATIAIAQKDIKKVLAYSTVSQLGYMFLGCGVGAYAAGVFHVITHAFFKALLFLGAGSVIHGMHEEQDIMKMGGLKTRMPKTFFVFAIGWLAICGLPPFSGFFSKDEILWQAFSSKLGSPALWAVGAVTAVMTAFYMTRLFSLTFLGNPRFKESKSDKDHSGIHVHESPSVMVVPLQILAGLSAVGGFMGIPHFSWLEHWLEPVIPGHVGLEASHGGSLEWVFMGLSVAGAVAGILFGLSLYSNLKKAEALSSSFAPLKKLLEAKWYVDELYETLFVRPILAASGFLWKYFDVAVVDRCVLSFGRVSQWAGQSVRVLQTGSVQFYAFVLLFGLVATAGYLVYGWV